LKKSRPPAVLPAQRHRIAKESDLYGARTAVRNFAAGIGFGRTIQSELVIVAGRHNTRSQTSITASKAL
jgi:hypothetical protein